MENNVHMDAGEAREYVLKCKVQVIRQNYHEVADGKSHQTDSVILVPESDTTEASRFFDTYLPDISTVCLDCGNDELRIYETKCPKCEGDKIHTEYAEVPSWLTYPVDGPARLGVLRKNNYCTEHHLYVMSTGAGDDLRNMDGKSINVRILSIAEDDICDMAKSVTRSVK